MAIFTVTTISDAAPIDTLSNLYESVDPGGDEVPNNGKTFLIIRNGTGAGAVTVTAVSVATLKGLAVQDPTVTIGEDELGVFGPFSAALFNTADGRVALTYSGGAAEIAAITF